LPELETQEREPFFKCCQPTLLLIHHQSKNSKLFLKSFPRRLCLLLRLRQQHHIIRIPD